MTSDFDTQILRTLLKHHGFIPLREIQQMDRRQVEKAEQAADSVCLMEKLQASEYRNSALVKQVEALKVQVKSLEDKLAVADQVKEYALQVVQAATVPKPHYVGPVQGSDQKAEKVSAETDVPSGKETEDKTADVQTPKCAPVYIRIPESVRKKAGKR